MDAKPQRPPPRAIRIHDENMPLHTTAAAVGKTLHQRTKSASNINFRKQALGEATVNSKIAPKDDSDIGKTSPGKMRLTHEPILPNGAAFARPAVRPLAPKSSNLQVAAAGTAMSKAADAYSEPVQIKVAPKKSTKVLRDPVSVTQAEAGAQKPATTAPTQQTAKQVSQPSQQVNAGVSIKHQIHTVPLRDDAAVQPMPVQLPHVQPSMPHVLVPHQSLQIQPYSYLQQQPHSQVGGVPVPLITGPANYSISTPTTEQYDPDEDFDVDQDYVTARSFGYADPTLDITTIFNPQHSKKAAAEIAEAKQHVEQTRTPDDVEDEAWDTSMVAEYGDEIFDYMREMETRMSPNPFYMELQHEIQWSMRAVLVDWVVQVHQRFNLLPETLFLTINYVDRFLSCKVVSLGKLQLVGATALFVAAKYEEVNCPTISEIIYMVDNGYTSDELLKAERFMLSMLQFELGWPGPMSFLRRISKADDYDLETRTLAKYFLEVTIMDERFVGCKPSFLAAGAHCMARLMLRKGDWTKAHVYYSNYTFRQLHRLLEAMLKCCEAPKTHHGAVFDKYTDKRYKRASTFVESEMSKGFQLPSSLAGSVVLGAQNTASWLQQQ